MDGRHEGTISFKLLECWKSGWKGKDLINIWFWVKFPGNVRMAENLLKVIDKLGTSKITNSHPSTILCRSISIKAIFSSCAINADTLWSRRRGDWFHMLLVWMRKQQARTSSSWLNDFFIQPARDINGRDFSSLAIFASLSDYLSLMTRKMNSNIRLGFPVGRFWRKLSRMFSLVVRIVEIKPWVFSCSYWLLKLSYDWTLNVNDYS